MTAHRHTKTRSRIIGTCLAVALTTAACGGGDDDAGSASGPAAGSGAASDLEPISMTFGTAGTGHALLLVSSGAAPSTRSSPGTDAW